MVRFRSVWTVPDATATQLPTTPTLLSRQGTLSLCPASSTNNSGTHRPIRFPEFTVAATSHRGSSHATAPPVTGESRANNQRPRTYSKSNSEAKPIKDPALSCGLVHCTVSSLSRHAAKPCFFTYCPPRKLRKPFSVTSIELFLYY